MGDLVTRLGNKVDGGLIKSDDWNDLVQSTETIETNLNQRIDELSASVDQRFEAVSSQMEQLENRVNTVAENLENKISELGEMLSTQVNELGARVDDVTDQVVSLQSKVVPFMERHCLLTMKSSKQHFAIGEMARLTAAVADNDGNPVSTRPWVDFVAAWGRLKPESGYESRSGAGERAISVRADENGLAKVVLLAEHADGFDDDTEEEVAASLTTRLQGANLSIAETILAAATPMQAKNDGAFKIIRDEHDRGQALSLRNYVDAYYMRNVSLRLRKRPNFFHRWRDYRSTVLAFVKSDADPLTPDQSRGTSSIQITFRDWIGPWLAMDYFTETATLLSDYRGRLSSNGVITHDFEQSTRNVQQELAKIVRDKGVVARQRDYHVVQEAVGQISLAQPPVFMASLVSSIQGAVGVQRMLETNQAAALDRNEDDMIALETFSNTATKAESGNISIQGQMQLIKSQMESMTQQVENVGRGMTVLEERTSNIQNSSGQFNSDILSLKDQIRRVSELNIEDVKESIGKAKILWNDRTQ